MGKGWCCCCGTKVEVETVPQLPTSPQARREQISFKIGKVVFMMTMLTMTIAKVSVVMTTK